VIRALAAHGQNGSTATTDLTGVPMEDDAISKLERLTALRDRGALTELEFEKQKQVLLSGGQGRTEPRLESRAAPGAGGALANESGQSNLLRIGGVLAGGLGVLFVGIAVVVVWLAVSQTKPQTPEALATPAPTSAQVERPSPRPPARAAKRVESTPEPAPSAPRPKSEPMQGSSGRGRVPYADRFSPSDCVLVEEADGRSTELSKYCASLDWSRCEESDWPDAKCPADIEDRPVRQ
jgi:hypothetical protein